MIKLINEYYVPHFHEVYGPLVDDTPDDGSEDKEIPTAEDTDEGDKDSALDKARKAKERREKAKQDTDVSTTDVPPVTTAGLDKDLASYNSHFERFAKQVMKK